MFDESKFKNEDVAALAMATKELTEASRVMHRRIETSIAKLIDRVQILEKKPVATRKGPFASFQALLTYFAIGALVHAWFLGPVFDPNNLWSWPDSEKKPS